MTSVVYEIVTTELGSQILKRTDPDGRVWWIPVDESNSDYRAYEAWLESQHGETDQTGQ